MKYVAGFFIIAAGFGCSSATSPLLEPGPAPSSSTEPSTPSPGATSREPPSSPGPATDTSDAGAKPSPENAPEDASRLRAEGIRYSTAELGWRASQGADGYVVAWAAGVAPSSCTDGVNVNGTSHVLQNLVPNTNYGVRLCAAKGDAVSPGITARFKTLAMPEVSGAVSTNTTSHGTEIRWLLPQNAGLDVAVAYAPGVAPSSCATGQVVPRPASTLSLQGLLPSTMYGVRVCTRDVSGASSAGIALGVTTLADGAPEVQNLTCAMSGNDVEVRWTMTTPQAVVVDVAFDDPAPPECSLVYGTQAFERGGTAWTPLDGRGGDTSKREARRVWVCAYDSSTGKYSVGKQVKVSLPYTRGNATFPGACLML